LILKKDGVGIQIDLMYTTHRVTPIMAERFDKK
jgi:hypothetical protein